MKQIVIDFDEVLKAQLIKSFELKKYLPLIDSVQTVDVSNDTDFQKDYDAFYDVRRNKDWRDEYFKYFQEIKQKSGLTFKTIIEELKRRLENKGMKTTIEPSFSSKMLHTIDTNMPIWDSRVLASLGLDKEWDRNRTVENAVAVYEKVDSWYEEYKKSTEAIGGGIDIKDADKDLLISKINSIERIGMDY